MISIIAAVSNNGVIGSDGNIPWKCPTDLAYFASKTRNKAVVMGRKTHESIGKILPGRKNIVVSRDSPRFDPEHKAIWIRKLFDPVAERDMILDLEDEIFIIGGQTLYEYFLPKCDKVYLTRILADVVGDTFFPKLDSTWRISEQSDIIQGEKDQYPMRFMTYVRDDSAINKI